MTWLRNAPQRKCCPSTTHSPPFSPPPPTSPISGSRNDVVNEVTTAVKAAPMTTATASSTTFPRSRKSLKPWRTFSSNSALLGRRGDRKSTRLNSSHANISYAVFCLKKKKKLHYTETQYY